jgi:hypothetical protein
MPSRRQISRNVRGDSAKEFIKLLEGLAYTRSRWQAFTDWAAMAAATLHNAFQFDQEVEDEYMSIAKRYTREELDTFAQLLALTALGLEEESGDFLGQVFEGALLANERHGQFFTPFSISQLLAGVALPETLPEGRILKLYEPACGAGGMVIAAALVFQERGLNYQRQLYVEAQDIDATCFNMAYIQLSLLGIPATVILGDTLALERRRAWATSMYWIHGFEFRLAAQAAEDLIAAAPSNPEATAPAAVELPQGRYQQVELFEEVLS